MASEMKKLVEKCRLENWEWVLKRILKDVHDERELSSLARTLGQRLENSDEASSQRGALTCYVVAGSAEKIYEMWSKMKNGEKISEIDFIKELITCVDVLKKATVVGNGYHDTFQPAQNGPTQTWSASVMVPAYGGYVVGQPLTDPAYRHQMIPPTQHGGPYYGPFPFQNRCSGVPPISMVPGNGIIPPPYAPWQGVRAQPVTALGSRQPLQPIRPVYPVPRTKKVPDEQVPETRIRKLSTSENGFLSLLKSPSESGSEAADESVAPNQLSPRTGFLSQLKSPSASESSSTDEAVKLKLSSNSGFLSCLKSPSESSTEVDLFLQSSAANQEASRDTSSPGLLCEVSNLNYSLVDSPETNVDAEAKELTPYDGKIREVIRIYCRTNQLYPATDVDDEIFAMICSKAEYWDERFGKAAEEKASETVD